eukprot:4601140-Heterocapsa_arctica.AAC.1
MGPREGAHAGRRRVPGPLSRVLANERTHQHRDGEGGYERLNKRGEVLLLPPHGVRQEVPKD